MQGDAGGGDSHEDFHRVVSVTFSTQPLGEVSEGLPLCRVHVHVLSVADVLIVHNVVMHSLGPCR